MDFSTSVGLLVWGAYRNGDSADSADSRGLVSEGRRMPTTVGDPPFQIRAQPCPEASPFDVISKNWVQVPWSLTVEACVREDLERYVFLRFRVLPISSLTAWFP